MYVELKFIEELPVQCAKAKTKQQRKEDTRKIIYIFRELLKKQREQPKIIYTKKTTTPKLPSEQSQNKY